MYFFWKMSTFDVHLRMLEYPSSGLETVRVCLRILLRDLPFGVQLLEEKGAKDMNLIRKIRILGS